MRKLLSAFAVFVVSLWLGCAPALAGDQGTREEAKAMAERAAAFLKANGKDKAYPAFNQGTDGFKDRDLYVFAYNDEGICVAIGSNPAMVGKNLIEMKDSDGKAFVREFLAVKTTGWVDYKFRNPQTSAVQPKSSYIVRVGDVIVGVGVYTN